MEDEQYRPDDELDGPGDPDAMLDHELDQLAAAIKDGAGIVTMMYVELSRCGLGREDAAAVAAAWYVAS